jgi:beta-N-acetylhexosaminidase
MRDDSAGSAPLRSLALGTLFPGFVGTDAPPARLARLIEDGLGGIVLFARNVDQTRGDAGVAELTARLKAIRPDLLVAIDEEGGDVTRLDAATGSAFPGSAALGAVNDAELTVDVAAALGQRLRDCGIDINFGPVADVDVDPRNPVVGVRAFGSDPTLVADHVAAFVAGQQSRGVAATVKHFPGHGATSEDSHLTVPVVDASLDLLDKRELVPFRAALAAGTKAVMTAHIRVPALDPDRPATLSRAVITGLLRDRLGFDGLVITDGLDMHAISRRVGHAEGGVQALLAGVDALCIGGDSTHPELVEEMVAAIVDAAQSGRLPYERLAEAAGRVGKLGTWARRSDSDRYGRDVVRVQPHRGRPTPRPALETEDSPVELAEVRAARRAVVGRGDIVLPFAPVVLELHEEPSLVTGPIPWAVGAPLADRLPGTVVVALRESGPAPDDVLAAYADRPVVVSVRDIRRRPWQRAAVATVRRLRPGAIVVDHGLSGEDGFAEPYVLAWGASRVTAATAADLMVAAASDPVHVASDSVAERTGTLDGRSRT